MTEENLRFIAYKIKISDLLNAQIQRTENSSNLVHENLTLGRINIIGTVISANKNGTYTDLFIDDGSGAISIRIFGHDEPQYQTGEVIQTIGRPRIFGQEKYIAPETIVKLEGPKWIELRQKEVEIINSHGLKKTTIPIEIKEIKREVQKKEECVALIRESDKGEGMDIEALIQKNIPEETIYELLKGGMIFETHPGRVKLLE